MADIRVIVAPMRGGKSEYLIALIRRMRLAGKKITVLKPEIDTRTGDAIASRIWQDDRPIESATEKAIVVRTDDEAELRRIIREEMPDVIFADEAQFFEPWLYDVVLWAAKELDILVYIAGLDLDAWLRPFGIMPALLALADQVVKLEAICNVCKSFRARYTQKLTGSADQIEIGDRPYEPRCFECFTMPRIETS